MAPAIQNLLPVAMTAYAEMPDTAADKSPSDNIYTILLHATKSSLNNDISCDDTELACVCTLIGTTTGCISLSHTVIAHMVSVKSRSPIGRARGCLSYISTLWSSIGRTGASFASMLKSRSSQNHTHIFVSMLRSRRFISYTRASFASMRISRLIICVQLNG